MHEGSSPSLPTMNDDPHFFESPEKLGAWFQAFLDKYNGALDPFLLTKHLRTNMSIVRFSQQNDNELAQILCYLYYRREEIEHYVELGVHKCGTFFVVDQFLRTFAPNYKYGVAVDGWHRTFTDFKLYDYQKVYPDTKCYKQDLRQVNIEAYPNRGTVFY